MKMLITAATIAGSVFAAPAIAQVVAPLAPTSFTSDTLEHSGGCRKSSPAGQCCHAVV